jgi:hypothetical protein
MPFADDSFDASFIAFGIRNVPDEEHVPFCFGAANLFISRA